MAIPMTASKHELEAAESRASFCWECGKKLARATCGKNVGELSFTHAVVNGQRVRIHKECKLRHEHSRLVK